MEQGTRAARIEGKGGRETRGESGWDVGTDGKDIQNEFRDTKDFDESPIAPYAVTAFCVGPRLVHP